LGEYLKELVDLDATQRWISAVSVVALVVGAFFAAPWALAIFLGVLMFGSFRLWRDRREIQSAELEQFKVIAKRLRDEINVQPAQGYRGFTYAEHQDDRNHHEKIFRKHFPDISTVIDRWCRNPEDRDAARKIVEFEIRERIPELVPEPMRYSVGTAILSYVGESLLYISAPPGKFDVASGIYDMSGTNVGRCLRYQDRPGQWATYNAYLDLECVDQIALELNQLSVEMWGSEAVNRWRELLRRDTHDRDDLRERLTGVIHKNHMTRKNCDQECY
jgi:hypothetical protein